MRILVSLGLISLFACNSGKADDDGADDTGGVSFGSGDGGGGGSDDGGLEGDDPVVTTGSIYCEEGSNSSGYLFFVVVQADDPQGSSDLDSGGIVAGWQGDTEIFSDEILVCGNDGKCEASFRDGLYGSVTCSTHDLFTFTAQVIDRDGNTSEPIELDWID